MDEAKEANEGRICHLMVYGPPWIEKIFNQAIQEIREQKNYSLRYRIG